jgi:outer membrane protein assembly factor BamB
VNHHQKSSVEKIGLKSHTKKWLLALLIIVIIVSVSIWYLFFNRSGRAPLWRQESVHGLDNFGTATYMDGILYAPSKADNKVYAVNASNGNIIWSHTVRQCDASPCIDGEVIYVGECFGPEGERTPSPKALALNRSTGEELWNFIEPGGYEWVGSPLVNGDYVYYTTYGAGVYALNKTSGNPIWLRADIGNIVCSVALHDGVVFVSAYDPLGQYALNATTGDTVWQANYGASWDSSPVVYNEMIIQVTLNRTTRVWSTNVINETTGDLIRRFEGKGSPSTPLVHDGKIFISSDDWRIWAFNLTNGKELWHTTKFDQGVSTLSLRQPSLSYCSAALADGVIYHQSLSGMFCAISEKDGSILWSFTLDGYGFGSPSMGDGCVFITNDSALYAFKIDSELGDWPMFCKNNFHQRVSE